VLTPQYIPAELIVPVAVGVLLHTPPGVALAIAMQSPTHTWVLPVIGPGADTTVTVVVAGQPVESVYVIAEVPNANPFTIPVLPMVAIVVLPLLHVPPPTLLLSVVVDPRQTTGLPDIGAGVANTVTALVTKHPPIE
jgi:hypothetical protein